ncbi:MAG: hypothetical protein M0019_03475 [Actinomycetota bacterium]|nr:hypothetical protein [Actinomycetota bacterium]
MATLVGAYGNSPQLDQPFKSSQPGVKNYPKTERMATRTPLIGDIPDATTTLKITAFRLRMKGP